jgi:preprotein translocase SecE subunit
MIVVAKAKKSATKKPSANKAVKVTRIKASDVQPKEIAVKPAKIVKKTSSDKKTRRLPRPFSSLWGYLKGAWYELRQVHWPNRSATWGLTGAVLIFTAFFILLILLLDILFKYLFELILK